MAYGFTLNRVSLFALIFSIGILVDDAIVVVENIHRRHLLEPARPFFDIIPEAVDEVGGPTILATFTVIAALMPMAFVPGLMGPYMSPIPINASMGMAISLAIAFVITPWLALKLMKAHGDGATHPQVGAGDTAKGAAISEEVDGTEARIEGFFRRLMTPLLDPETGRAARRKLWLGLLAAIAFSLSLAVFKLVLLKMMPFDNKSEFQVVLDMPVGTPLPETNRVLRAIADEALTAPEVTHLQLYAGTAAPMTFNGLVRQYYLRGEPEMGDLQVNLEGLALPGVDRDALGGVGGAVGPHHRGGGGVVLGGEDVARHPADVGAERHEGLDQHGGLDGHVQRAHDAGTGQRLRVGELGAGGHEAGHLVLGELDLLAAEAVEREVGDLEVVGVQDGHVGSSTRRSADRDRAGARPRVLSIRGAGACWLTHDSPTWALPGRCTRLVARASPRRQQ